MKLSDQLIRTAIEAIENTGIVKNGAYESQFNGYIASFGAAIIQSGLLPAVIFFENSNANSEKDRTLVIKGLIYILKEHYEYNAIGDSFPAYLLIDGHNTNELLGHVNNAAAALKLALRTFKKKEDEKK